MTQRHVTIIGAGIVGICSALHLQRRGFQVTVVDRLPPGEATSFGNACIITDSSIIPITGPGIVKYGTKMLLDPNGPLFIRPGYALKLAPWLLKFIREGKIERVRHASEALAALLHDSLREHHKLADNTPAARWIGDDPTLFIYHTRTDFEQESFAWEIRRELGIEFETLDQQQLHALEPAIGPQFQFGTVLKGHGKALNPSKLTKAHAEWLQRNGGQVLLREVRGIDRQDNRPVHLITDAEPIELDILLIAAGPWSVQLSRQLGDSVPLESEGGYHITVTEPDLELTHPIMDTKAKVALTHMELGVRIGGLVEFAGLDAQHNPNRNALLRRVVKTILPEINTEQYTDWRGERPTLPDSLPVISRSSHFDNVYYAFGNQHVGLSSGPKTGKLVSQLIAGEQTDIDLTAFRINRF